MATTKVSLAIHPGEHISDELEARGMSAAELARMMGVDPGRVSRLIHGQTSVTGDTAIRLAEAFGTSAEFWMRLQGDHDLARAREARLAS
jgi:addiction module HigA family antidote